MPHSFRPQRRTRVPAARVIACVALTSGVLVTGCGGGSPNPAAGVGASTPPGSSAATGRGAAGSGSAAPGAGGSGLAFAKCMRANGVPNFPDPAGGRGLQFKTAGLDPSSPAFRSAQARCSKLLPAGGPPRPGTTTHPSAQTMAKLLTIARCMRQHGVSQFPDPRTSVPPNPFASGIRVITDYDGAILLFPSTLNMQSPAYRQAAAACGALAGKLGSGPH